MTTATSSTRARTTRAAKTTKTRKTTSTRKTAAAKPDTTEAAMPDSIRVLPEDPAGGLSAVDLPLPEDGGITLRKKELIDLAVTRSGVRKRDAKPAIEAALAIIGEALAEGRELNLQPLGKLKVTRMKKGGNGQIINARVRQPEDAGATEGADGADSAADPLAQAAE